jgi:hypothetical protein
MLEQLIFVDVIVLMVLNAQYHHMNDTNVVDDIDCSELLQQIYIRYHIE